ncbi:hypothetical protein J437_LFUL011898 [Ladona fulva]|uniref:Glutathione-specific gamma-glutamylcyclotransferase n=1 Tax=Ladona fulva TaxID=123851 RepID=A0A8K0KCP5_LADFU|nr:hypothetical protein J437_LFUL011898 [Ladona fulva]
MFYFAGNETGATSEVAARVLPQDPHKEEAVWVFGYGSLCWFPGFEYKESVLGCVTGFKRRFWQGNATHRGTAVKVSYFPFL